MCPKHNKFRVGRVSCPLPFSLKQGLNSATCYPVLALSSTTWIHSTHWFVSAYTLCLKNKNIIISLQGKKTQCGESNNVGQELITVSCIVNEPLYQLKYFIQLRAADQTVCLQQSAEGSAMLPMATKCFVSLSEADFIEERNLRGIGNHEQRIAIGLFNSQLRDVCPLSQCTSKEQLVFSSNAEWVLPEHSVLCSPILISSIVK